MKDTMLMIFEIALLLLAFYMGVKTGETQVEKSCVTMNEISTYDSKYLCIKKYEIEGNK